jgi:predicted dithiol-disulfide oxidoreductase (DUF899 family)
MTLPPHRVLTRTAEQDELNLEHKTLPIEQVRYSNAYASVQGGTNLQELLSRSSVLILNTTETNSARTI